jgi:hypothetical protein
VGGLWISCVERLIIWSGVPLPFMPRLSRRSDSVDIRINHSPASAANVAGMGRAPFFFSNLTSEGGSCSCSICRRRSKRHRRSGIASRSRGASVRRRHRPGHDLAQNSRKQDSSASYGSRRTDGFDFTARTPGPASSSHKCTRSARHFKTVGRGGTRAGAAACSYGPANGMLL